MQRARLIIDPPASGVWNMAVDESLLVTASESQRPAIRFYTWEQPTLSLGYFQSLCERHQHAASRDCPVVRRSSGGGAILHDGELTYSFATPLVQATAQLVIHSYDLFHDTLIATLGELGITAWRCATTNRQRESRFLCFQRRSAGDVLLGASKIAGSAQRRHARALLQHGSILLHQSKAAPELDGIRELARKQIDQDALRHVWLRHLEIHGRLRWELDELTVSERQRAREFADQRFGTATWINRR